MLPKDSIIASWQRRGQSGVCLSHKPQMIKEDSTDPSYFRLFLFIAEEYLVISNIKCCRLIWQSTEILPLPKGKKKSLTRMGVANLHHGQLLHVTKWGGRREQQEIGEEAESRITDKQGSRVMERKAEQQIGQGMKIRVGLGRV